MCRNIKANAYYNITGNNIHVIQEKFEAITLLWNVLGHIPTNEERIQREIMKAVILAGGLGSILKPFTEIIRKNSRFGNSYRGPFIFIP